MPFYNYRCQDCKTLKEDVYEQMNNDSKFHACPCGGEMKRIITVPAGFSFITKPAHWDMKHSERRARWNSADNREKL